MAPWLYELGHGQHALCARGVLATEQRHRTHAHARTHEQPAVRPAPLHPIFHTNAKTAWAWQTRASVFAKGQTVVASLKAAKSSYLPVSRAWP